MMIRSFRLPVRIALISAIAGVVLFKYFTHELQAYPFGWSGGTEKALLDGGIVGCTCHNQSPAEETSVVIASSTETFEPGKTYQFTVGVSNPTQVAAGVDIAAFAGTLDTVEGEGLQSDPNQLGELIHYQPKAMINHKTSWSFLYTAPTDRTSDTIYAVANAVNANGMVDNGDFWNTAPKFVIQIAQTGSVATTSDVTFNVFPNPVSNEVTVSEGAFDITRIAILDLKGVAISRYEVGKDVTVHRFDVSLLPAGSYMVLVTDDRGKIHSSRIVKR